ncbi:MAG: hypothetical protein QHH15_00290 [Candidatus Thermoplasmatota archaeon]|nr:hypothetical protein [Candidatus Thermoplasmatota archaeon]
MTPQTIDLEITLRLKTEECDKLEWILQSIFGLLIHDDDITKVGIDVKR